jgi:cytochrome c553
MQEKTTGGAALYCALCLLGMMCGIASAEVKLGKAARSTEALAYNCYTCHWIDSDKPSSLEAADGIPTLHGRTAEELLKKLREFRNKQGSPTIMNRIAAGYSDEDLARIANFIAAAGKENPTAGSP